MKNFLSIILGIFILMPGSLFHDMLIIMLLSWIWRKEIRNFLSPYWKHGYPMFWSFLVCLTLIFMPRPFSLPTDRAQLVYFNSKGEKVSTPIKHWIFNIFFPEETICAIGSVTPLTPFRSFLPLRESILKDYDIELKSGGLLKIGECYRLDNIALESPMSGVVPQAFNQYLGGEDRSAYIIRPKNYDKNKKYPVLFFAHGFLGNWKLYTGILRNLENHIIVCMGTEDLSGIFTRKHINEISNIYIPLLHNLGYDIDFDSISLMGLSNGGSAVDMASSYNPHIFKNLIYVSTGVNHSGFPDHKIMVIGGGKDHCAPSMRRGIRNLTSRSRKGKAAFLFDEEHTHLKLLSDLDNCIDFLNKEL